MTFCERLKSWRESRDWTQPELADHLGVSVRSLTRWESGEGLPNGEVFAKLTALGADPTWLLGGESTTERRDLAPVASRAAPIDDELLGRVTDAIARLYKEERVSLAPIDLGRLAGRRYAEITVATDDPVERLSMIKLMVVQLRRELHATAAEPGKGKASA